MHFKYFETTEVNQSFQQQTLQKLLMYCDLKKNEYVG